MHVGIGFSEIPETFAAGAKAARDALAQGGLGRPCDAVLLFSTVQHEPHTLRKAVVSIVGQNVPIIGGAAVGAITNDQFGYAGDQVIVATFWWEQVRFTCVAEGNLPDGEEQTGVQLGKKLADRGVREETPVVLFYDAISKVAGQMRLIMATPLLHGIKQGLGFFPHLVGAGLQGDFLATPTKQWLEKEIVANHVLALAFSGDVRMDTAIMHGCRPATGYYTVTKADQQTILEINNEPALLFMDRLLKSAIPPEDYGFFLIFGINKGDKWGEFDEKNYASRLCLSVDKERNGIVMFEPDMVAGTEFQLMYRSAHDLTYMPPRIEALFANLQGRKPVLALYIDCAGRAAGFSEVELEDAVVVQNTVAGRVPLLGLYTGVEIAPVEGTPRGLDWTGVFCLLSVPDEKQ